MVLMVLMAYASLFQRRLSESPYLCTSFTILPDVIDYNEKLLRAAFLALSNFAFCLLSRWTFCWLARLEVLGWCRLCSKYPWMAAVSPSECSEVQEWHQVRTIVLDNPSGRTFLAHWIAWLGSELLLCRSCLVSRLIILRHTPQGV